MADPDSQAQLPATSAASGSAASGSVALPGAVSANGGAASGRVANSQVVNGPGSKRDSEDIVAEIEETRQNLARTIDALADRVSPANNVRRLRERAAEELAKPEVQLAAVAAVLAVTGIAIYRIWGRRRG